MKTTVTGVIAGVVLAITPAQAVAEPSVPNCIHEDGPGPCYWDARVQGNGVGRSYWIKSNGIVLYDKRWTPRDGRVNNQFKLVCLDHQTKVRDSWHRWCE